MTANELAFQNWQNGLDWDYSCNSIDTKTVIQLTLFCEELKQSNDMENNNEELCNCSGRTLEPHTCPYLEDINHDSTTMCNCCAYCEEQCSQDI